MARKLQVFGTLAGVADEKLNEIVSDRLRPIDGNLDMEFEVGKTISIDTTTNQLTYTPNRMNLSTKEGSTYFVPAGTTITLKEFNTTASNGDPALYSFVVYYSDVDPETFTSTNSFAQLNGGSNKKIVTLEKDAFIALRVQCDKRAATDEFKNLLDIKINSLAGSIDGLKSKLSLIEPDLNSADFWERGSIDTTGTNVDTYNDKPITNVLRTKTYISDDVKLVYSENDYTFTVVLYDSDGTYAGVWDGSCVNNNSKAKASTMRYVNPEPLRSKGYSIRLVCRKSSAGALSPINAYDNVHFLNENQKNIFFPKPTLTFIDDDGAKAALTNWESISDEIGVKITSALTTGIMREENADLGLEFEAGDINYNSGSQLVYSDNNFNMRTKSDKDYRTAYETSFALSDYDLTPDRDVTLTIYYRKDGKSVWNTEVRNNQDTSPIVLEQNTHFAIKFETNNQCVFVSEISQPPKPDYPTNYDSNDPDTVNDYVFNLYQYFDNMNSYSRLLEEYKAECVRVENAIKSLVDRLVICVNPAKLSWDEVGRLRSKGFEFVSHTHRHINVLDGSTEQKQLDIRIRNDIREDVVKDADDNDETLTETEISNRVQSIFNNLSESDLASKRDEKEQKAIQAKETIRADLNSSTATLREHGCNHQYLVYPYNGIDADTTSLVKEYFTAAVGLGGTNGDINQVPIFSHQLHRYSVNQAEEPDGNIPFQEVATLENYLDIANINGGWIILMTHMYGNYYRENEDRQKIIDVCKYAVENGMTIRTFGEAFDKYKNVLENGNAYDAKPHYIVDCNDVLHYRN